MKKRNLFFVLFCIPLAFCNGQTDERSNKRKVEYSIFAGGGLNTLHFTTYYPEKFSNIEFRLGIGATLHITKHLDLKSRITLGRRLERSPTLSHVNPNAYTFPRHSIEEMTGKDNYFFYEVPVTLQANVLNPLFPLGLGVHAGVSYRRFAPYDHQGPPYLPNDFGVITGIEVGVAKNIALSADYYFGLIRVFGTIYSQNNQPFVKIDAFNRYFSIGVNYKLRKHAMLF